ncbi:protein COFACTOR ASSEMBLY OF COMPLEX C SUBUNIT B CCB3, chloroplastic-like isoform X2 [Macadamia integrifolia]|uniref:protein COFACTOR ASSEMBLY OF COMPLEX C SUBUNIT B CCB3, chloroplastic-like isoform X2 n=1 Tax=Macadamia integrifolia TaxID=60698 RepID=UPI001C4EBACB|nr:protein COFACTOR ASSEMBLY OF COMPLEX C SUBUNIT B CCB3, chloroplastic-like isoform X2 [Macadamia integrifolia]XP_042510716.1 protein COFACTOR ASSEMBLY OF COMPLEX C SUBUNIT B CCB3, chloroplastic-like isoform X2 [Macadamia integrifolia]
MIIIIGFDSRLEFLLCFFFFKGPPPLLRKQPNFYISERFMCPTKRRCGTYCLLEVGARTSAELSPSSISQTLFDISKTTQSFHINIPKASSQTISDYMQRIMLADLDPSLAKLAIGVLGPFLSAFAFLFIVRIVMSWYPKLPVGKFPYVIVYAPTEPLLVPTRKLIPPLGGVDVTPVVWFGLLSFINEILLGPQGLLVLLSQQV